MTTLRTASTVCAACGAESPQSVLTSTSLFGSPDLDQRPPELARSTLPFWVQECPHCRYVAERISAAPADNKIWPHVLSSADWQELLTDWSGPALASRFLRLSLLDGAANRPREAAKAALCAAWVADDAADQALARICRTKSASLFDKALSLSQYDKDAQQWMRVCLVDVLRRAEDWEIAASCCAAFLKTAAEGNSGTIFRFQADMIDQRISERLTIADALSAAGQDSQERFSSDVRSAPRQTGHATGLRAIGRWPTSHARR